LTGHLCPRLLLPLEQGARINESLLSRVLASGPGMSPPVLTGFLRKGYTNILLQKTARCPYAGREYTEGRILPYVPGDPNMHPKTEGCLHPSVWSSLTFGQCETHITRTTIVLVFLQIYDIAILETFGTSYELLNRGILTSCRIPSFCLLASCTQLGTILASCSFSTMMCMAFNVK
jgi:hypothetical protein